MNPRESHKIVEGALRWSAAREHRLVAAAAKRRADDAEKVSPTLQKGIAEQQLAVAWRAEQRALDDLAKLCQKFAAHSGN